ncbi:hypothetical protein AMECASPLE_032504 [Ameca splendens]|uniref:Secreted protein n=1 Tax=Ameca splendens TaxID=208324 RepID=A0ABV1A2S3_9TELE
MSEVRNILHGCFSCVSLCCPAMDWRPVQWCTPPVARKPLEKGTSTPATLYGRSGYRKLIVFGTHMHQTNKMCFMPEHMHNVYVQNHELNATSCSAKIQNKTESTPSHHSTLPFRNF